MSVNVWEYDYGTKAATIEMLDRMKVAVRTKWKTMSLKFLKRVYMNAIQECPVDTGALRASHRITQGDSPNSERPADETKFIVARGMEDAETTFWLKAGGGGYINPKKNREIDYAQAVHEKNPWMDRAYKMTQPELDKMVAKVSEEIGQIWESDQPITGGYWKIPMPLAGRYSNIMFT